jgi:hypothetical protein
VRRENLCRPGFEGGLPVRQQNNRFDAFFFFYLVIRCEDNQDSIAQAHNGSAGSNSVAGLACEGGSLQGKTEAGLLLYYVFLEIPGVRIVKIT